MEETFNRRLGLFSGISILAGIIIGTGIFLSVNGIFIASGLNPTITVLAWIVGGMITLFAGLCYGELGASMPRAGGAYIYLTESFGSYVGFLSGISGFLISGPGSLAAIALGFANFLGYFFKMSGLQMQVLAVALILLFTIINYYGVQFGGFVQNITLVGKLIPLILIIAVGLFASGHSGSTTIIDPPKVNFGLAIILSLWAYEGWTNLNTVAEEIKHPQRNIPLAIATSIILVMVVYVSYNIVLLKVLTPDQLMSTSNPASLAFEQLFGKGLTIIVTLGILISILGSLNGCTLVFPRTYYAMANRGLLFKSFKTIHPKHKTPSNAIIWSGIIGMGYVLIGNFSTITAMVVFTGWIFNALTIVSIFRLRKKYPDMKRPYRVIGFPVVPIIVLLGIGGILLSTLVQSMVLSLAGIVIILGIGTPMYFIFTHKNKGEQHENTLL